MCTALFPLALLSSVSASISGARSVQEQTQRLAEFGIDELGPKNPAAAPRLVDPKMLAPREKESAAALQAKHDIMVDLMAYLSFAFLLKAGAIASSVLMTFSPLRAVWRMQESKSTLAYPPYTFFCGFACGLQWCIYGTFAFTVTQNYGFLILVYSNAFGVLMGTYYVHTYFVHCNREQHRVELHTCAVTVVGIYIAEAFVIPLVEHSHALLIVGTVAACLSILVSVAPIADLPYILLNKDVSGMPRDVVLAGFVCSVLWLGCALLLHDTWILIPNLCGVGLGGFQLLLLYLYETPKPKGAARFLKAKEYDREEAGVLVPRLSFDGTGGTGESPS